MVTLMTAYKIYAHHPEKLSFRTFNFCLIVARFYIYTATKENEPLSFQAIKILLKSKLSNLRLRILAPLVFFCLQSSFRTVIAFIPLLLCLAYYCIYFSITVLYYCIVLYLFIVLIEL